MRNWPRTMNGRLSVYVAFVFVTTFAIGIGGHALLGDVVVPILLFWVVAVGIAQFVYLACPHCGSVATITPQGMGTPFVGDKCRHCGKSY